MKEKIPTSRKAWVKKLQRDYEYNESCWEIKEIGLYIKKKAFINYIQLKGCQFKTKDIWILNYWYLGS